jgi:acetyltransferase-like isoleucine patch superfamily enzyme
MRSVIRLWRTWNHGRKFAKKGRGCRFPAKYLEVDGHVELGDYCRFRNNVILRTHGTGKIVFGNRAGCSYNCILEATELIQIGTFTGIAEFTVIRDTNHDVFGTKEHWRYTPYVKGPIVIGDNVLIGSRVYIGPNVTIGEGAVVGHGSIVTKNIGPYEIWAGMPARKIAHRTENVPKAFLRRHEELVQMYGIRKDRYDFESPLEQDPG